jgi:hypothetical protein
LLINCDAKVAAHENLPHALTWNLLALRVTLLFAIHRLEARPARRHLFLVLKRFTAFATPVSGLVFKEARP